MQVVHPVCGGIDVHQARLTAGLRCVLADGHVTQDVRECATTYSALLALTEWLVEQHGPMVAMESTGVYGQPMYHVLSETLEVVVGNAQEMRRRPGRKTDNADARWIAELLAHGLIRPSFLPPPADPGPARSDAYTNTSIGRRRDPEPRRGPPLFIRFAYVLLRALNLSYVSRRRREPSTEITSIPLTTKSDGM